MRRGLPVERYTRKQVVIAYWGISLYWGACLLGPPPSIAETFCYAYLLTSASTKGFDSGKVARQRCRACECSDNVHAQTLALRLCNAQGMW